MKKPINENTKHDRPHYPFSVVWNNYSCDEVLDIGGHTAHACVCSDNTPWLSDLQQVADMATSQYSELKGVCQHLKQQNEALKTLVRQLVYGKDNVSDLGISSLQFIAYS